MKRIVMLLVAVAFMGATAMSVCAADKVKKEKAPAPAKEKKVKKEKKDAAAKPALEDLTITGVLSKSEEKKGEKTTVKYVLTDGEGKKITIPAAKKGEDLKLDDYVNAAVVVTGTGMKTAKGVTLKTVTKVEKAEGAADVKVFPEAAVEGGNEGGGGGEDME